MLLGEVAESDNYPDLQMGNGTGGDECPICKAGCLAPRTEELAFLQWTDRGPVCCRVTIVIAVCSHCKFKTWGKDAEQAIQEAVLHQYSKLSGN